MHTELHKMVLCCNVFLIYKRITIVYNMHLKPQIYTFKINIKNNCLQILLINYKILFKILINSLSTQKLIKQ